MGRRWRAVGMATVALSLAALVAVPPARAAGTPGTRSIVSVVPGPLSSRLGQSSLSGPLTVQVAETSVTGDASWYVTAQASTFTDASTPAHSLPSSALANSSNSTVLVGGGGTIQEGGTGTLDSLVTLFTDTGENPSLLYNGTYTNTSTLTLTPPNGSYAPSTGDTYTSVITVTLFS